MAYKEVASLDADNATPLGGTNRKTNKPNPKSAEGYFLGTREVDSKKSKNGKAKLHFLQTPKGNLGIWGKTDMDRKLSSVAPGTMIRITHTGMQNTPNGEMYKYKVEVDASNKIEVAEFADAAPQDAGDGDDNDDYATSADAGDGDDNDDVDQNDVQEERRATTSTADRQAKVQALLNRNKSKQA